MKCTEKTANSTMRNTANSILRIMVASFNEICQHLTNQIHGYTLKMVFLITAFNE